MSSLVDACHSQDFLFDCTFCTFCLDRSSVFSVGALELPASGQWGSPTACASLPLFIASSLSSLTFPTLIPSLVFRSPSSSPPSHTLLLPSTASPLTPPRQYEEKQLKGQQERAQRRLEFANQESRLQNQLAYERQRDTMGMCIHESLCVTS